MGDKDKDLAELERHVAQLGERFDTIRIFATTHSGSETFSSTSGGGNLYAQLGQVREWLIRQDEMAKCNARRDDE